MFVVMLDRFPPPRVVFKQMSIGRLATHPQGYGVGLLSDIYGLRIVVVQTFPYSHVSVASTRNDVPANAELLTDNPVGNLSELELLYN